MNRPFLLTMLLLVLPSNLLAQGTLDVFPQRSELNGLHEGRQLLVTGADQRDLTRDASYSVEPAHIVRVSTRGYVRPIGKGSAVIRVEFQGQKRDVKVDVKDFDEARALHFVNDIEPLLSRHGCNSGGCHGRASGQNGFRLSLFGFDPAFDYNALVKEARGRRIFAASPDNSLLLVKAAGLVAHGGGKRLTPDSEDFRTLRRWIMQGAPLGDHKAPTLAKLTIVPDQRVMQRKQDQQIAVLAHYSDGTIRDVSRQSQFQSNELAVAAVDGDGLVRTFELSGDATIMARYMGQVAVFRALVPLGKAIAKYPDFPANNYIDTLALARWKKLGIVPSELCGDSEFIRRVTVDLCGRLPTNEEVKAFLAEPDGPPRPAGGEGLGVRGPITKRGKLIDRLLDSRDYAAHFAMRWGNILRNASLAGSEQAAYGFHEWIRDNIARNRPHDEFVRGVVAAAGEWQDAPAVNWYWQMRDDQLHQPVADTAQVFLGLRLQCAKCHHHPYERWSQNDYYGLAGFFSRLGRKGLGEPPPYYASRTRTTSEINPTTGKPIEPKLLDGPELKIPADEDPRHKLVDWMAQPENPFFARALANRMWGHLMGRGLVDPVDDMRETNPPSNPELLDALAKDFTKAKFDVKHLLRTICNSRTYQLSSEPNEYNQHDKQNHARYYARRMIAEVLHDAIDQVTDTRTTFQKMSRTARAVDLPHEGFGSYFLDVFDRPPRSSACECARSDGANLPQVLHLSMSPEIERKISNPKGRVAKLIESKVSASDAVTELYLAAFARTPTAAEQQHALKYLQAEPNLRRGLEDLCWALMNSREFMYNH